ncbi:MAG: hypothetical protein R3320_10110 [Nitriliruptorales bacterium]|nr:hypothetical protein [Nitriliruptorales bacterium]
MTQDREAVDDYVEEFKAAYVESLGTRRFASMGSYLADDVVVLASSSEPMDKAALGSWIDDDEGTRYDATFTTRERIVTDELVVERGVSHEGPMGGDDAEFHDFNYLWLIRSNGSALEVSHLMWNQIR